MLVSGAVFSQEWKPQTWPVLKQYDREHLYQVALPLGGIGTGTVSLGGRGELRDWEIMNVPGKKYSTVTTGNNAPFFAIYAKPQTGEAMTTLLAGPLYPQEYLHYEGRPVNHHGMPRFADATFEAAYPFGQVHLSDRQLPVKVTVKGFNPLVPGDYIPTGAKDNKNQFRKKNGLQGLYLYSDGVDKNDPAYGTVALTTQAVEGVTYRTSSRADNWNNGILNFWDDFSADGELTERDRQHSVPGCLGSGRGNRTSDSGNGKADALFCACLPEIDLS